MNLFITGCDTDVGKTYITSLLLRNLRSKKIDAIGMKPIETGGDSDARQLHAAVNSCIPLDMINPVRFQAPLAPAIAAEREGKSVSKETIFSTYRHLAANYSIVLVEGAGGWRVPITQNYEIADLAFDLAAISPLQILVVALDRLGVINHTLLTIESIRAYGLQCAGFILNQAVGTGCETLTHAHWITQASKVPFLFSVHHGQTALSDQEVGWFVQ